jgi:hypothetical protein
MEAFVSSGLESSEKATAVIELCQSEPFEHSKAYAVMHNAGFNGSGFNAGPDYGAITSNLERVMACLRISHRLQAHIDETLDRRAPMPVSEPLLLIPVNALYLMKNAACCVQSESEFKEIKGEFGKTRTALQELFRAAEGAARQVSGFIDTERKKRLASENKKMRDDQKEKEKIERQKVKETTQKTKGGELKHPLNAPIALYGSSPPSLFFTFEHENVKEICTFNSPEQLGEFRCKQADPLVGFTDSPYIVKGCKIKEVCTDKEVWLVSRSFKFSSRDQIRRRLKGMANRFSCASRRRS